MENMEDYLRQMAKRLNLTNSDEPEEYILTPDEEREALKHAIKKAKEYLSFRMSDKGLSAYEIESRISQIDWQQIENEKRDEVLKTSNSNKHHVLWEQQQRQKERQEADDKINSKRNYWTSERLLEYIRDISKYTYKKELIENNYTSPLIKVLCYFIAEDPRFETELGYDLKKGLWIRGNCGLGKTYLPKCLKDNGLKPLQMFSMIGITGDLIEDGKFEIKGLSNIIYLDDVGSEQTPINHYGTIINWFKSFFEDYYYKNIPFNRLIISTNSNAQQIEDKYGFRLRSRVKEAFNVIDVLGDDLRC